MVFSNSSSSASKTACQRSATMRCAMVFSNHVHERSYNIIGYKWQRSLPFVGAMSFVHGWSVQVSIWPAGKAAMSTTCEAPSKRSLLDQTLLWSFWDCILNLKQKMLLRNMCFTLNSYVESTYCEPKLKKSSYHIQPESKEKSLGWFFHRLKHRWTKWLKLCPKTKYSKMLMFFGFFLWGPDYGIVHQSGHSRTFFSHHLLRFSHQLLPFSHLVRLPISPVRWRMYFEFLRLFF